MAEPCWAGTGPGSAQCRTQFISVCDFIFKQKKRFCWQNIFFLLAHSQLQLEHNDTPDSRVFQGCHRMRREQSIRRARDNVGEDRGGRDTGVHKKCSIFTISHPLVCRFEWQEVEKGAKQSCDSLPNIVFTTRANHCFALLRDKEGLKAT